MKKNLIITLAVLVIAAMATTASAATITYDGKLTASFTHSFSATEVINPVTLAETAKLELNLKFNEGDKVVAYLPLTISPVIGTQSVSVGNWYAAFNSSPVSFWVSNNNSKNTYKFAALGDPLGIGAKISSGLAFNANGTVLGAKYNVYAADLGSHSEKVIHVPASNGPDETPGTADDVAEVSQNVTLQNGNVFLGRVTYGLPMDFTLGAVGVYTNGIQSAASVGGVAVISETSDYLTLGLDVTGKIPGLGAKLTAAVADSIEKEVGGDYATSVDHLAFQLKLEEINVGPVAAWAKFTGVGANFDRRYRVSASDDENAVLNKYAGKTAVEVEGTVDIPVGIPVKLTLGNGLWMDYAFELSTNETYASVVVEPLADLALTVSGAYTADIDGISTTNLDGWKVHGDAKYTVIGLTINPYIDYMVDCYADTPDTDFVFGLKATGSPAQGLTLESDVNYTVEEKELGADVYANFTTEENFGLVQSAKSVVAGMLDLTADFDFTPAPTPEVPDPEEGILITYIWHAYAGSDLTINDKLTAKVGGLYNDAAGTIAASGKLSYKASDTIGTNLILTYREDAPGGYAGWKPFDFDDLYLEANVTSTIGKSTFKVAYGDDGLESAPTDKPHKDKPWAWLFNKPSAAMPWDKLSFSVSVPF